LLLGLAKPKRAKQLTNHAAKGTRRNAQTTKRCCKTSRYLLVSFPSLLFKL
jgi:hypothetical protein